MNQTKGLTIIVTPPDDDEIKIRIAKEARVICQNLKNIRFRWHDHNHSKMLFLGYKDNYRIWNGSQNFQGSRDGQKYHEMMTEVIKETHQCKELIEHLSTESQPLILTNHQDQALK